MQTCYQNKRKTTHSKSNVSETNEIILFYTELFSEPLENNTFQAQSVRNQLDHIVFVKRLKEFVFSLCFDNMSAWNVIRTLGKHNFLNSTLCFLHVLIRFHADMLSEHKANNTFQIHRVRNQWSNIVLYRIVFRTNGKQHLPSPTCPKPIE